jgi:polysaccharide export outer membrane protein
VKHLIFALSALLLLTDVSDAQTTASPGQKPASRPAGPASPAAPRPGQPGAATAKPQEAVRPIDYVIGSEDVLGVVFWREPEMSGDVTVRPDGRITIPVIGEVQAAGKTPEQLQAEIVAAASKYISAPNAVVVVRTINSRKVFVTGRVTTPGTYPLTGALTVMQAIALAGGLTEFANPKNITILRTEAGQSRTFTFNYQDVARGRSLEQNIQLRPGDTVVVP